MEYSICDGNADSFGLNSGAPKTQKFALKDVSCIEDYIRISGDTELKTLGTQITIIIIPRYIGLADNKCGCRHNI